MKHTLIPIVCCALLSSVAGAGTIADKLKEKRDEIANCEAGITDINQNKINSYNVFLEKIRDVFNKNQDSTNLSLDQGFTDHALSLTDGISNVHTLISAAADDINSITRKFNIDIISTSIGQAVDAVKQIGSGIAGDPAGEASGQSQDLQPIDIESVIDAINESIANIDELDKDL